MNNGILILTKRKAWLHLRHKSRNKLTRRCLLSQRESIGSDGKFHQVKDHIDRKLTRISFGRIPAHLKWKGKEQKDREDTCHGNSSHATLDLQAHSTI